MLAPVKTFNNFHNVFFGLLSFVVFFLFFMFMLQITVFNFQNISSFVPTALNPERHNFYFGGEVCHHNCTSGSSAPKHNNSTTHTIYDIIFQMSFEWTKFTRHRSEQCLAFSAPWFEDVKLGEFWMIHLQNVWLRLKFRNQSHKICCSVLTFCFLLSCFWLLSNMAGWALSDVGVCWFNRIHVRCGWELNWCVGEVWRQTIFF